LESLKKTESLYLEMEITPESYWLKQTQKALASLELKPYISCQTHRFLITEYL